MARCSFEYGDRIPITEVSPSHPARNARLGRKAKHAEGKASLNEGHGFSRAVNRYSLEGFTGC
jgi:hypothetical protein